MNKNAWYLIGLALIIIIIQAAVITFKKPIKTITLFNDKPYLDSITLLVQANKLLHIKNDSITIEYQNLKQQKSKIKIIYYAKYKFIKGASATELDSIIRYNW